jgi:hypothetical protein
MDAIQKRGVRCPRTISRICLHAFVVLQQRVTTRISNHEYDYQFSMEPILAACFRFYSGRDTFHRSALGSAQV